MSYQDFYYTSQEGLRLYARLYGDALSPGTPVLCLPGLTRNSKDFGKLAEHLSAQRRVICPDFRGRGLSAYCESWTDYTPQAETRDTFDLMTALGIPHAAVIGTSRGGLVATLMAAQRPGALKGVVLNDVGPEISPAGIKRIMGYAGKMNAPENWDIAAITLRQMNERQFPTITGPEWHEFARQTFRDEDGKPALDYDTKIGDGLRKGMKLTRGKVPDMWTEFNALLGTPVLVLRGENSDLLSADAVARMQETHPRLAAVTVKDRGHAPWLDEPEAVTAIDAFLEELDRQA